MPALRHTHRYTVVFCDEAPVRTSDHSTVLWSGFSSIRERVIFGIFTFLSKKPPHSNSKGDGQLLFCIHLDI